ncbi:MAG: hypothetical protein K2M95_06360 [Clostridiales bacterium]|nr:hypothetical protein [Clostridiales bacterium]
MIAVACAILMFRHPEYSKAQRSDEESSERERSVVFLAFPAKKTAKKSVNEKTEAVRITARLFSVYLRFAGFLVVPTALCSE